MKIIIITFEYYEGGVGDLVSYEPITWNLVFDSKLGDKFHRK